MQINTTENVPHMSKGYHYKDQIEELFIVMVLFCVFPTRHIFNFLVNFTF